MTGGWHPPEDTEEDRLYKLMTLLTAVHWALPPERRSEWVREMERELSDAVKPT